MPLDTGTQNIPRLKEDKRLAALGRPQRMWVVGSLYGRYGALCQLHDMLTKRLRPKDRIVYLGNYLGEHSVWTGEGIALIDELVAFRNAIMSIHGFFAHDITFLKGRGEDLFEEALRLPFQNNPEGWLSIARNYNLECYMHAYGAAETLDHIGQMGVIAMNRWTHGIQQLIKTHAGHASFFANLKTAAHTHYGKQHGDVAFVPAGLNTAFALNLQHDLLCWPENDIEALTSFQPFVRIVRGQSFKAGEPEINRFVLTLDDGGGMNGSLYAACLDPQGRILEWLDF